MRIPWNSFNVVKTTINHPPVITISIGGMSFPVIGGWMVYGIVWTTLLGISWTGELLEKSQRPRWGELFCASGFRPEDHQKMMRDAWKMHSMYFHLCSLFHVLELLCIPCMHSYVWNIYENAFIFVPCVRCFTCMLTNVGIDMFGVEFWGGINIIK